MDVSRPRSLRDPEAVAARRALWQTKPTLAALRDYVGDLSLHGRDTPAFDPTDAGTDARVMFVLEAPGPKSATTKGSGFISADNNDQTATNIWQARTDARLIDGCIQANIVPWYLGTASVKPTPLELADGSIRLRYLIDLLPSLDTVVLCGDYARQGWRRYVAGLFDGPGPVVIETHHPSPQSLNFGTRRAEFTAAVARAAARP